MKKGVIGLFLLLVLSLGLTSCTVPHKDYTDLKTDVNELKANTNSLTRINTELQRKVKALEKEKDLINTKMGLEATSSEIKNDYIELYQDLVLAGKLEAVLDYQYELWKDEEEIYTDKYRGNFRLYKGRLETIGSKIDRLKEKLDGKEISGLPEDLNEVSELEELKAAFDVKLAKFEEELELMG